MDEIKQKCNKCLVFKYISDFHAGQNKNKCRNTCKECRKKTRNRAKEDMGSLLKKFRGRVCHSCKNPRKLVNRRHCKKCLKSMGMRFCKKCRQTLFIAFEFERNEATCNDCK